MGKKGEGPVALSERMREELSIDLLREWWITTTQALVSTIGSEAALKHLKPYFVNSGLAGAYQAKKLTNLPTNEAGDILVLWIGVTGCQVINSKVSVKSFSKNHAVAEVSNCITKGICPEACYCYCVYGFKGGMDLNPEFEMELIKSIP